ncbi:MAG: synthase chain [Thermosediminibacterales bacterium]|nr:synthase chain [Thermosediminibacterales bacterium]MDK2836016.1 synthase chain [Thermosediminibacterales bacterium]
MDVITKLRKDVLKKTVFLLIILQTTVIIFFDDKLGVTFGILLGTFISIFNFYLLSSVLTKTVNFAPKGAFLYTVFHYFLRYLITFLAMLAALIFPTINFYAVIVGLFIIKTVLLMDTILKYSFRRCRT